ARQLAQLSVGGADRSAPVEQRAGHTRAFCRKPVQQRASAEGARRDLAVLVHRSRYQTQRRNMVATEIARSLCAHGGADARRQNCDEPVILFEIPNLAFYGEGSLCNWNPIGRETT